MSFYLYPDYVFPVPHLLDKVLETYYSHNLDLDVHSDTKLCVLSLSRDVCYDQYQSCVFHQSPAPCFHHRSIHLIRNRNLKLRLLRIANVLVD